jgi:hypothetical protein
VTLETSSLLLSSSPLLTLHAANWVLHPSPGLALGACLVFGCSVSSFIYRHRHRDPLQIFVFTTVLVSTAVVTYAGGTSPSMILLGFLPPATAAAMALSLFLHAGWRLFRAAMAPAAPRGSVGDDEEKRALLH